MAIIMVIDDHTSTRIGFLDSIFPYNSFYMPLFVFISGYFYKCAGVLENIKHKVKKLLIPYVMWNIVMVLIALVLDKVTGVDWIKTPSIEDVWYTFIFEPLTSLNAAAWFVIMLFWVSVIYNLLRNIFKTNAIWDIILTGVHFVVGLAALYLCMRGYYAKGEYWVFALKIAFYIQFFHYGYMFHKYIEKYLLKCNKIAVCSVCIAINVCLILFYGRDIEFWSSSYMAGFKTWYLPVVTSMTGIVFYYEVMEFLSRKIGTNPFVDFISRNTLVIMQSHLLFVNIPNFYAYYQALSGNAYFADFDIERFRHTAGFRYSSEARLVGFFCGLIGSLIVAWVLEQVKAKLKTVVRRSK